MPALADLFDNLAAALVRPRVPPRPRPIPRPHRLGPRQAPLLAFRQPRLRAQPSRARSHSTGRREAQAGHAPPIRRRQSPFRHLTLRVTPDTLLPRPATELLVELVIAAQRGGKGTVVDVGTGTGAIALALAAESAFEQIIATDTSEKALAVAKANLQAIPEDRRPRLGFRPGDLLAPSTAKPSRP